jgi:predicted patatin/cPLA2 family phospholipase
MNQNLCWNNNYVIKFDEKLNTGKFNDYINKLLNKSDEKNVETKIDQIEKDYQNKLKDIEIMCENKSSVEELKVSNSLNILQKELEIIKLLTKYTLQNKNINYDFFLNCLDILLNLSETLRIRISQKEINHDKQNELKQMIVVLKNS